MCITHEQFVQAVAGLAIARLPEVDREPLEQIKLVYGAGRSGLRGVTYFGKWSPGAEAKPAPFVEVCAFGQEGWTQIAGTTLHELGHVLAGWEAAHGKTWKQACERLGLRRGKQAGTRYLMASFEPDLRAAIAALPKPDEGEPVAGMYQLGGRAVRGGGCMVGVGTRGGKRAGSRLRLWECACVPAVKVRVARDTFEAHCDCCKQAFSARP